MDFIHYTTFIILICLVSKTKAGVFKGCYKEMAGSRVLAISPGDYNPEALTPAVCSVKCGASYPYSAVTQGKFCFCGKTLPPISAKDVSGTYCNKNCSGDPSTMCGGKDYASVYTASTSIVGLAVETNVSVASTGDTIGIKPSYISAGSEVSYKLKYGDGAGFTDRNVTGMWSIAYYIPGTYAITLSGNDAAESLIEKSASVALDTVEPAANLTVSCPIYMATHEDNSCKLKVVKGTAMQLTVSVNGVDQSPIDLADALSYPIGIPIPAHGPFVPGVTGGNYIIMPSSEFKDKGIITGFQMVAETLGDISIYILKPSCTGGQTYCFETNLCTSSACNPPYTQTCSSGIFCGASQTCYDTANTKCLDPTVRHDGTQRFDLEIKYTISYTISKVGYQYWPLDLSQTNYEVDLGYILAYKETAGGRLNSRSSSAQETDVQSSDPTSKASSSPLPSFKRHLLGAVLSRPSEIEVLMRFSDIGPKALNFKVQNIGIDAEKNYPATVNVLEGINYCIPDIKQCLATGKAFDLKLAAHTGSSVTYNWTMDNGDSVVSMTTQSYNYSTRGTYNVSVSCSNPSSSKENTTAVLIQDEITGFALEQDKCSAGDPCPIKLAMTSGSDYTCTIVTEGKSHTFHWSEYPPNSTYNITLNDVKTYTVKGTCTNCVGSKTSQEIQIAVKEKIQNLKLTKQGALKGKAFVVGWEWEFATEISCILTMDSVDQTFTLDVENKVGASSERTENTLKTFSLNLTCWNLVSSQSIITEFGIDEEIIGPNVTHDFSVSTESNCASKSKGDTITLRASVQSGTRVNVTWDFDDGNSELYSTSTAWPTNHVESKSHTLTRLGHHYVNVTIQNGYSTFHFRYCVIAIAPVQNLVVLQPTNNPENVLLGPPGKVSIKIGQSPSGDPPNEATIVFNTQIAFQAPLTESFQLEKIYDVPVNDRGPYTVKVNVSNYVSFQELTVPIKSITKIKNIKVDTNRLLCKVGSPCAVKVGMNGDVDFDIEVTPESPLPKLTGKKTVSTPNEFDNLGSITYTSAKVSTVSIKVTSPLETVTENIEVIVQTAVTEQYTCITNHPVDGEVNMRVTYTFTYTGSEPTNATITLDYGDNTQNLEVPFNTPSTWTHDYATDGDYTSTLCITNQVSQSCRTIQSGVYKRFVGLSIVPKYNPYSTTNTTFDEPGFGVAKNEFPVDKCIRFHVSKQQGTHVKYEVTATNSPTVINCVETSNPVFEVCINDTGTYACTIKAVNPLYSDTISTTLTLKEPVRDLTISTDGNATATNTSKVLTFGFGNKGSDTCLEVNYGDGIINVFGDNAACSSYNGYKPNPSITSNTFVISHVYTYPKTFLVRARAFNNLSSTEAELEHVVSGIDCSQPYTDIEDKKDKYTNPKKLKRGDVINVIGVLKVECGNSVSNTKLWTIKEVNKITGNHVKDIDITKLSSHKTSQIGIPSRFLEIGLYKFVYTVTMEQTAEENVKFESFAYTYIEIGPSDLVAAILPVSSIQKGLDTTVTFNPKQWSIDPDTDPNQPQSFDKYTWYCRNKKENYPSNIDEDIPNNTPKSQELLKTYHNKGGCFRDGPGKVSISADTLTFNTDNMETNNTYELILQLEKDSRKSEARLEIEIVPYKTPDLSISVIEGTACRTISGGVKCSTSTRIALDSECDQCPTGTAHVWSIDRFSLSWLAWIPVDNLATYVEGTFGLNSKKVEIGSAVFKQFNDTNAIFRVTQRVTLPGGVSSSVSLNITLNEPPSGGTCSVTPSSGTVNDYFTVSCNGWSSDSGIQTVAIISKTDSNTAVNTHTSNSDILNKKVKLPKPNDGNNVDVYCRAEDVYEAATEVHCATVAVTSLSSTQLQTILDGLKTSVNLDKMLAEGDTATITNEVYAIAAMANQMSMKASEDYGGGNPVNTLMPFVHSNQNGSFTQTEIPEAEREKMEKERNDITEIVTKCSAALNALPLTEPSNVVVVVEAAKKLTAAPENVGRSSQKNIFNTLNDAASACEAFTTKNSALETPIPMEKRMEIMTSILMSCYSVQAAISLTTVAPATDDLEEQHSESFDTDLESQKEDTNAGEDRSSAVKSFYLAENKLDQQQVGESSQQLFENIQRICRKFMFGAMVVGAGDQSLSSELIDAKYRKRRGSLLANNKIQMKGASVELGSLADMGMEQFADEDINLEAIFSPLTVPDFNREEPNHEIGSVSISVFRDNSNTEIDVKNVKTLMSILIPRASKAPIPVGTFQEPYIPLSRDYELLAYNYLEADLDETIQVTIVPEDLNVQLLVIFKCDRFPNITTEDMDFSCMIPHQMSLKGTSGSNTVEDPYTCMYGTELRKQFECKTRKIYIGYKEIESERHDFYQSIVTVSQKTMTKVPFTCNMTILGIRSKCQYYDRVAKLWKSDGVQVGPLTNSRQLQCLTSHFTTFTGGWAVAPNTIDWNFVFSNADFFKNPTLYITEIVIAVIYILAVIWARRKDHKDVEKLGLTPMIDNDKRDKYYYEIVVVTGMRRNAGTDSKVNFILSGEEDETDVRILSDSKRPTFRRGGVDGFLMAVSRPLGPLNYCHIWHDNSGKGSFASWYLRSVVVRDVQKDEKFIFICNRWFAVENDDGLIDRIIPVAGKEQMTEFTHLFTEKTSKSLSDGHLWFSVVARPPQSRFTRVQRVSCCLCLLFCSMLTNAMFYEKSTSSTANSFTVGPFSLSAEQVYIGVLSNLIVFPVNFLIIFIFRKSRPRSKRKSRVEEAIQRTTCKPATSVTDINPTLRSGDSTGMSSPMFMSIDGKRSETSMSRAFTSLSVADLAKDADEGPAKKKKKKLEFPWYFIIFGWILLWIATLTSCAFVTFYGIMFQDIKCKKWITSMLISFFASVFITQPVKVFLTAIVFSLIIKNPGSDEEEESEDEEKPKNLASDEELLHGEEAFGIIKPRKAGYKPADSQLLEKAREIRMKEIKMWAVVREILFYSFFVWILMVISYQNRSVDMYYYKYSMTQRFIITNDTNHRFIKITNVADFWLWAKSGLVDGIRAGPYYNGEQPLYLRGYINDKVSRIMGYATMRQVRVKRDTCRIADEMVSLIEECNDAYDITINENQDYGIGWKSKTGNVTIDGDREEYRYTSASDLDGYPYWGQMAVYGGGGYVVRLRGDTKSLKTKMAQLQAERWIDKYTRAVFVEFTVYNPGVNLFAISTLLAEYRPSDGIFPSYRFEPAVLLPYMNSVMLFQLICEGIYLLFTVYFIVKEIKGIISQKLDYFKQFWNLVELSLCIMSVTAVVIYFYRLVITNTLTSRFKESHGNEYMKFQYVGYWSEIFTYIIGWLVFFGTLKFLKLLRFNRRMSLLASTLKNSCKDLMHFSIIFNIVFLAFIQLFHLVYVGHLRAFMTFVSSCESGIVMMMGKFEIYKMLAVDPVMTQVFLFLYVVAITFIVVNMFLSILNETFSAVRNDINKQNNDYEIVDFMLSRFKLWTGLGKADDSVLKPEDVRMAKKESLEGKIDNFPDRIDRLLSTISSVYMEKERMDAMFDFHPMTKKSMAAMSGNSGYRYDDSRGRRKGSMTMVHTN